MQVVYNVGYSDDYAPLSYTDEDGNPQGVAIDMMEMIKAASNININYVNLSENPEMEDSVDMSLAFVYSEADELNMQESDTYLEVPLFLIQHTEVLEDDYVSEGDNAKIGMLDYYGAQGNPFYINLNNSRIVVYSKVESLSQDFVSGDLDEVILTTMGLNRLEDYTTDVVVTSLGSSLELTILFQENYPEEKIEIFNRLISQLDQSALDYSLTKHSSLAEVKSFIEILNEYRWFIFCGIMILGTLWKVYDIKKKRQLLKLVDYDALTGLYSEHKFIEEAKRIMQKNPNKAYCIMSVDIDNFKYINEIYGYVIGTKVIAQLGKSMREQLDNRYIAARSNSDIFLVFLETGRVFEKVAHKLGASNDFYVYLHELLGDSYSINFSMGLYNIYDKELDFTYMIDCSNIARGLGKNASETTIYEFTQQMSDERGINNEITSHMNKAIQNKEFVMYYQSKVDLKTGNIVGVEALVRWINNGRIISPNDFIPIFEKNRFIVQLDYYVLRQVCGFIRDNRSKNVPVVSVNLSGITISEETLVRKIMMILDEYGVKPEELDIEITESAVVENFEISVQKIGKLQSKGFTISMDDFGTGISTLNRLKGVPLDTLKLDREFLVGALDDEKGTIIIKNVITMANELKIETVAEGVETKEQCEFLVGLGCNIGQGYYFSKPVPGEAFLELL
ncbi:MAG: EAL domain-containing protein, partial [Eubacteriales bacterium]